MSLLFGKKVIVQVLAEVIEDGREKANQEMKKARYKHYEGVEPMIDILVRVQPENEPPFESKMKTGLGRTFLLKPGVKVLVKYELSKKNHVTFDDDSQEILKRNPQLIKKE